MGLIVNGKWVVQWYETESSQGEFQRQDSRFRHTISAEGPFRPEAGRYHLYVSLACPWVHRTLIFHQLKQLQDIITVSVVRPEMRENGWEFGDAGSEYKDDLFASEFMYQLYLKAAPDYQGRVTVPVLWDKQTKSLTMNLVRSSNVCVSVNG